MEKRIITLFFIMAFTFLGYGQQKKASYIFVIQPKYDMAGYFNELVAPVSVGRNQWTYITNKGVLLSELDFSEANEFVDGCAVYKFNGIYIVMNVYTGEHYPLKMANATAKHFSEGILACKMNDGWGYVNTLGKVVVPGQYKSILC